MSAWVMLGGAIISEVLATLALRSLTDGIRPLPVVVVVVGYLVSLALMAYALRTLNVGVVYAVWAGLGTAGTATAGTLLFHERLSLAAVGGLVLIVAGVAVLASSGGTTH